MNLFHRPNPARWCGFCLGLLVGVLAFGLGGCKSASPTHYVSPRVVGQVVDGDSGQPVQNARVRRVEAGAQTRSLDAPKGGQQMDAVVAARTDAAGNFDLDSLRDLALFRTLGWYSVTIEVAHPDYERFTATYSVTSATNAPSGEPVVVAGRLRLTPRRN